MPPRPTLNRVKVASKRSAADEEDKAVFTSMTKWKVEKNVKKIEKYN